VRRKKYRLIIRIIIVVPTFSLNMLKELDNMDKKERCPMECDVLVLRKLGTIISKDH
jgi:hypothetical protein